MDICYGKPVMEGISIGKLFVYNRSKGEVTNRIVEDPDSEWERFLKACDIAIAELDALYKKALNGVGKSTAFVFIIQQILVRDPSFITRVEEFIREKHVTAEYAVAKVSDDLSLMFKLLEEHYMTERAQDFRDICGRIVNILTGGITNVLRTDEPVILITDDLEPSETVQLNPENILSFVTINGSPNSHTAILAKTMGIPALINTKIELDQSLNGKTAVVDGYHSCIYIDPDEMVYESAKSRFERDLETSRILKALIGKKAVNSQGQSINLYANINTLDDLDIALQNDAEGIGLYRTEFLYLTRERFPTEYEQFAIYKSLLTKSGNIPVTIRTADLGSDKKASYLHIQTEKNPALGIRGVRFSLSRTDIFRTQLRALLRASVYGKLRIIFPMIINVSEILTIKKLLSQVENELIEKKIEFGDYEIGIMIETPAAVMISDLLAQEVDFFSIGTNDLTQYMLAVDRQNSMVERHFDSHHKAVLRAVQTTALNAKLNGIYCGLCGDLAGDLALTDFFLNCGLDYLSAPANKLLAIKQKIIGV